MLPKVIIRQAKPEDMPEMQQLFANTILSVGRLDYTEEQTQAWASSIENRERWIDIFKSQYVLIAEIDHKIIGFCTLDYGNYLDLLYVHKDYQRQGIAQILYSETEKEAKRLEQTILTADVSIIAKPFFEKMGFKVIAKQTVIVKGVAMTNYKMVKKLS